MKRITRRTIVWALVCVAIAVAAMGQPGDVTVEERLVALARQLRMGMTLATVAAHSPTLGDLRLHAQQLVNLLEGAQGKHFVRPGEIGEETVGLLVEATSLEHRFEEISIVPEPRARIVAASTNVRAYLSYALDAALSGLDERRLDRAASAMLRAYAFLLAAYEGPCGVSYVPALWTILRAFELTDRVGGAAGSGTD